MRFSFGLAMAALTLTACGGTSPEAQLRADCTVIVADVDGQKALMDMNADKASFCDCLNTNVLALAEAEQVKARATLTYVSETATETGQGIEDVAGALMGDAMMSRDSDERRAIVEGVPIVGEVFDKIEDDFDAGVCKRGS